MYWHQHVHVHVLILYKFFQCTETGLELFGTQHFHSLACYHVRYADTKKYCLFQPYMYTVTHRDKRLCLFSKLALWSISYFQTFAECVNCTRFFKQYLHWGRPSTQKNALLFIKTFQAFTFRGSPWPMKMFQRKLFDNKILPMKNWRWKFSNLRY